MTTAEAERERDLLAAVSRGEPVELSQGDPAVRAGLLIDLLTAAAEPGRPRPVRIRGARVTGHLDLEGCVLPRSLLLRDCRFEEVVNLDEATAVTIRLPGCHLPGLTAQQLHTTGHLELNNGFTAEGEVNLTAAHIGGILDLSGARLSNPGAVALSAGSAIVARDVICRDGFAAEGEVNLMGASLQALDLTGAILSNPDGRALSAMGLIVQQNLFCRDGFTAEGEVRLIDARVGGRLIFKDAGLTNRHGLALDLELATAGVLILRPRHAPGGVDLTNAHVGAFDDDPVTWPTDAMLLRGFTFGTFEKDEAGVRARLRLIAGQPGGYTPQPYDQLAAAYRADGREEAARRVAIAKQWHRRQVLNPVGKFVNWLLYVTVGYGYRTWLAAVWLVGLAALGTGVFASAHPDHMARTSPDSPPFHALAYTLDVLLPIIDLGQQKAWQPGGGAMYWSWALIAAGWVLTTAVAAGLTGVIKRD